MLGYRASSAYGTIHAQSRRAVGVVAPCTSHHTSGGPSLVAASPSAPCCSPAVSQQRHSVVAHAAKGKSTAGKGFGAPKKIDAGIDPTLPCPCQSGKSHEECCQPYLNNDKKASTPELLLRSRYTAYALKNADYVADTTHVESPEYSGSRNTYMQSVRQTQRRTDWLGLEVVKQEPGATPDEAFITFRAYFVDKQAKGAEVGKRLERIERSKFVKDKGNWMYMRGDLLESVDEKPEETAAQSGPPTPPTIDLGLPKIPLPSFKF